MQNICNLIGWNYIFLVFLIATVKIVKARQDMQNIWTCTNL